MASIELHILLSPFRFHLDHLDNHVTHQVTHHVHQAWSDFVLQQEAHV